MASALHGGRPGSRCLLLGFSAQPFASLNRAPLPNVGRSSAVRCIEAALMHQPAVKAAPRTGQLKNAAGVSRRARPRRECWAVGTLLADPWLLERDVHTVGGQVESQPARL
jgi:hypothetical protein